MVHVSLVYLILMLFFFINFNKYDLFILFYLKINIFEYI